jgi:hypothetical protein
VLEALNNKKLRIFTLVFGFICSLCSFFLIFFVTFEGSKTWMSNPFPLKFLPHSAVVFFQQSWPSFWCGLKKRKRK